ncbi:MAG TPA: ATP-binding protein [Puia sp.]|nr:ATP-binding protein [Puia sp.]
MFKRNLRLSRSSLIVIIMCLVVLFTIFFLSYLNLRNISTLSDSVSDLSKEDSSIILLRKCNEELMTAENHYRIYINAPDNNTKSLFLNDINSAIEDCNKLNDYDSNFSKKIEHDVNYKMIMYDAIKRLRNLSDSVNNGTDHTFTIVTLNSPVQLERMNKSFFKNFIYNSTDTLKLLAQRKKMNFFQKIGYLFSGKDGSQLQSQFIKGSPEEKRYLDSVQHESDSALNSISSQVRNYYQKSVNKKMLVRQQLTSKELGLAESNLNIMSEIDSKINELLSKREDADKQKRQETLAKADDARKAISRITFFSLLSILVLIGLLVYNIYRTNKYEEAIIEAKSSAEKLAVLKGRFLSNMSHEIRSPLTAIMGFTEQIANKEQNEQNGKFLDAIKVSSNHLLNTVNDILDFSKLDAGKLTLTKQPFSLKNAIDEVAFAFSLEAEKKGIALNTNTAFDEKLTVNGDAYRFKQILYNLISNAVKFTDKGSIDINALTKKINDKNIVAVVGVKDSGIGILPSQLNMIFQEFAQVTNSKNNQFTRAVKGTGLGLPISKMLAELQNGSVTVESEPGKGSVFTVKIPYEIASADAVKSAVTPEVAPPVSATQKSGKNILVVEDNELNIMLISLLLERMGYPFDVATDGEMALQLQAKNNYSLILTDINIPKLTGVQLAEQIRKGTGSKSKVKIVALTATILNDDFDSYYKAGINKILVKPFKEEEFRQVVEEYVS